MIHDPGAARIKAARQLAKRSFRDRSRLFLAEGPQAVREALGTDWPGAATGPAAGGTGSAVPGGGARSSDPGQGSLIRELFVTAPARARHEDLVGAVLATGAAVHEISGELMAELAQTVTPQGLLAVCPFLDQSLDELMAREPALVVVLANVRDPGNAGTVLRTADAAGAGGVIFAAASVDPYNSKCVRSSAGSLFHLPFAVGVPLPVAVTALKDAGLAVLAADGSASGRLDELEKTGRLAAPTGWLFGNEAWGLPPEYLALADEAVAVPIYGRAESLNLAAAAAVLLYASARAHAQGGAVQVS
jgi:RNA methyltransferase, TrmH family